MVMFKVLTMYLGLIAGIALIIGYMVLYHHMNALSCRANGGIYSYQAAMCFRADAVLNHDDN